MRKDLSSIGSEVRLLKGTVSHFAKQFWLSNDLQPTAKRVGEEKDTIEATRKRLKNPASLQPWSEAS